MTRPAGQGTGSADYFAQALAAYGVQHALLDAFGPAHCVWTSDWPFLRAPQRLFGFEQP